MKILLGLMDIANQMRVQALYLALKGHMVRFYDATPTYLAYQDPPGLRLTEMPKLVDYDIFEIFFASFGPAGGRPMYAPDCKYLHHFCGSEVRQKSIALAQNPFARVKEDREEDQREMLIRLAQLTDHCTLRDMELYDHVKPYFKNIHIIPRMLDLPMYPMTERDESHAMPLIVHAPTDPYVKGTQFIVDAVNKLREKGLQFRFRLIAGLPHEITKKVVGSADLLIDQLCIGTYGVAAIEAMALGTPVMAYISDYMQPHLPGHPIRVASPDTIEGKLEEFLDNWDTRRAAYEGWRKAGRIYVEENHDAAKNIVKLMEVYQCL